MAGPRYEPRTSVAAALDPCAQLFPPRASKLIMVNVLGLCFCAWALKIIHLCHLWEKHFYGLAGSYVVGLRCYYFIFSQCGRKYSLDTKCLSLERKASFPHQAQGSAALTPRRPGYSLSHAEWQGLVGALWLSKSCLPKIRHLHSWNVGTWSAEGLEKVKCGYGSPEVKEPGAEKGLPPLPTSGPAAQEEAGTGGGVGLLLACQLTGQFTRLSLNSVNASLFLFLHFMI